MYMEVVALWEIAKQLGKNDWDFNLNPCDSNNSNWMTSNNTYMPPQYNNTLICNCSFPGGICHVQTIEIKAATNNFDAANKIGEGGFGPVYKGTLLDGTIIAVKQLSSKSKQGYREFLNEIGMVACLKHPNLVKLYGCCVERKPLLLIYEYLENNSLAHALFGPEDCQLKTDWSIRGYMAPEYALWGYLTFKADVYSFGIVTLEILAGKNNVKRRSNENYFCLLDWALVLQRKGNLMELIDSRLGSNFDKDQALRMVKVALLCTNTSPVLRPSMSAVVSMLEGHDDILEYDPNLDEYNFQAMKDHYDEMAIRSVNALKEIAEEMGKKDWDFRLNPCDNNSNWKTPDMEDMTLYTNTLTCNCSFPAAATNNFDATNKIGEGGFGSVYKGTLMDGTVIAVKQLSSKSSQGNREFLNEIGMISCLQHPNLVKLYGCCVEGKQLLLVYEYLENNSLAHALFGYMAPEYAMWGYLTYKADVYSFGVVALEIVAGKSNMKYRPDENFICVLDWALDLQKKGKLMELIDPRLGSDFDKEEALRMTKVALLCTNPSPVLRPSMSAVVNMLEGHYDILEYKSDQHEFNFEAMRDHYDDEMLPNSSDSPNISDCTYLKKELQ
nr:putative LRR receptor-like serine/threonine-protein kinase [Ipomoea batatas]